MGNIDSSRTAAIASVMSEAASLVETYGPTPATFVAIGDRVRRLALLGTIANHETLRRIHGSAASAAVIGRHADGSVLMLAQFPTEAPTPVHNHNSWGVIVVVEGSDRYERWERQDGGGDPQRADVRLAEELILHPGDMKWFGEPPQDLHAQQGFGGPCIELAYFGRDPMASPRAYFDPTTGTVTYESAGR